MNENDKKKLDYLVSHAITNIISWDDLRKSLSDDLFQSDEMTDVLLYIQNQNIDIVDFKQTKNTTQYNNYNYITLEVYKFKDCIPEIKKQENGIYFAEYLKGNTLDEISTKYRIDKKTVASFIRKFCSYTECSELESKYLPLFVKYQIKQKDAIDFLFLDIPTFKFLHLKSLILKQKDISKYRNIDSSFNSFIENCKLKEK
ncbi:hypothetical protein J5751_03260 [bacterium]|nr:hypothetical protein [bacterium]